MCELKKYISRLPGYVINLGVHQMFQKYIITNTFHIFSNIHTVQRYVGLQLSHDTLLFLSTNPHHLTPSYKEFFTVCSKFEQPRPRPTSITKNFTQSYFTTSIPYDDYNTKNYLTKNEVEYRPLIRPISIPATKIYIQVNNNCFYRQINASSAP